jgi:hypothetical protein
MRQFVAYKEDALYFEQLVNDNIMSLKFNQYVPANVKRLLRYSAYTRASLYITAVLVSSSARQKN